MAQVGLSEAARLTRRAHTTIHRAMKAGRLSFTLDAAGERRIDTAELDRVFGLKVNGDATHAAIASGVQRHSTHVREIELLTQQLADRDATIRDLRGRLDAEAEERRRLTAVLADQRTTPAPKRRSWLPWRR